MSGGETDEEEGATDSSSDSEPSSCVERDLGSLIVPSSRPALTNSTGILRSLLPASKALLRWPDTKRASSARENLGFSATRSHQFTFTVKTEGAETYLLPLATAGTWKAYGVECVLECS